MANVNTSRYRISGEALFAAESWMPTGLTRKQTDEFLRAVAEAAEIAHEEGRRSEAAQRRILAAVDADGPPHRHITINLDSGAWATQEPLSHEEALRVAASVLPGFPVEILDASYKAWRDSPR